MKTTIPRKLLSIFLFLVLLSQSACSRKVVYDNATALSLEQSKREVPMQLYIEEEVKLGHYEPTNGIYTGAYVQKDENVAGDLMAYETLIGQPQTFKVFEYNLEEKIPSQEILRCIAQKKIPYIKIVLKPNYDLTPLYQLAFELKASYNTPVFIELFPLTSKDYQPAEYKKAYQRGYEIIKKYVKSAVVVWSCDESRVSDMPLYYPGESYIDWAGINVYIPRYKQGERYVYEGTNQLDFWYKTFQHTKPMLISSLAISHFSRVDHTYAIYETKEQLNLFYDAVLSDYPRLRGILYMDIDMQEVSKNGKEDYRLTSQPALMETMKALTKPLACLTTLQDEHQGKQKCYMKYSVRGTFFGERLYLSEDYMSTCFPKAPLRKIGSIEDLSGTVYYDFEALSKYVSCYYKL